MRLDGADALIVPGVGAAEPAMARLDAAGLTEPVRAWAAGDRPFLGICLGLQLLFDGERRGRRRRRSASCPAGRSGSSTPRRCPTSAGTRSSGRGRTRCSTASPTAPTSTSSTRTPACRRAAADDAILATTDHGGDIRVGVARGALLGVQFHPERSGRDGLRLLANFVDLVRAA